MIYLIGGPARCGKSTLAQRVRQVIDGSVLSGDAVVYSLKNYVKEGWVPGLFTGTVNPVQKLIEPGDQLGRLLERDVAVWPFYEKYIEALQHDVPFEDILIDGNLWPELVKDLPNEHRAVFLVNLAEPDVQARGLIAIRDSDAANNWMRAWSDERIKTWAYFNLLRSQRYVDMCTRHGYPYFDVSGGFSEAQERAFDYLVKKEV